MRSMVEGFLGIRKNPSTALRAVPLPEKSRGGIREIYPFFFPLAGSGRITLASAIAATLRPSSSPASLEKR